MWPCFNKAKSVSKWLAITLTLVTVIIPSNMILNQTVKYKLNLITFVPKCVYSRDLPLWAWRAAVSPGSPGVPSRCVWRRHALWCLSLPQGHSQDAWTDAWSSAAHWKKQKVGHGVRSKDVLFTCIFLVIVQNDLFKYRNMSLCYIMLTWCICISIFNREYTVYMQYILNLLKWQTFIKV